MTSLAVKRMISKFEVMGSLDNRPGCGQMRTSVHATLTVQEEMVIAACLSMHGEISAHEVAHYTSILHTTIWVALQHMVFV